MRIHTIRILATIFLLSVCSLGHIAKAQKNAGPGIAQRDTVLRFEQEFMVNSSRLSSPTQLENFLENVESLERSDSTIHVDIVGRSSIDGSVDLNHRLARQRAETVKDTILALSNVDPSKITTSAIGEDWALFRRLVESDYAIPGRDQLLTTIDSSLGFQRKESRIRYLYSGRTWNYLKQNIFPQMRSVSVTWELGKRPSVAQEQTPEIIYGPEIIDIEREVIEVVEVDEWVRKLYIKSNAPAWAILWVNAAVEIDLAPHWSAQLPVYWAGWNYFKRNLKLRNLTFVPEVRWWPKRDNMGFFANAHLGLAWYNYAGEGEYRYQDHKGRTPALGGGVGVGYRFYFCKNRRWSMEAGVGAGIYRLKYDLFDNIPNGPMVGTESRTFYGVDQAFLSFCYSFGLPGKKN